MLGGEGFLLVIKPRRRVRSEGYSIWFVSVCVCLSVSLSVSLSLCLSVCLSATQEIRQSGIVTGIVLHWLEFTKGDFHKNTVFQSYGM